jgi:hypothetical protein
MQSAGMKIFFILLLDPPPTATPFQPIQSNTKINLIPEENIGMRFQSSFDKIHKVNYLQSQWNKGE